MSVVVRRVRSGGHHLLLIALAALSLYPLLLMVMTSFKDNPEYYQSFTWFTLPLHPDNYSVAWTEIAPYLVNSIVVTGISTVGVVVISALAAYAFARFAFPAKELLYYLIIALMMVPGVLTLIPSFDLMKSLNLLDTRRALIFPYIAGGEVFAIFVLRAFFASLPEELFEAARIDGAGDLMVFWRIGLPLVVPALGTVAILQVISSWNDYLWPLVVLFDEPLKTLALGLVAFQGRHATDWGPLMAGYTLGSIPLIILFALTTRTFIQGLTSGGLKI